jgi:acyl-CoA synthetase (AMP-forming)/AMP-acid ligase II
MRAPELDIAATVPALLARAVEQHGDGDFVVAADTRCTFREAEARSRALAKRLLAAGVGKGARVGLMLPSGVDWAVCWLAAARIGAISMLFSSTYRPGELRDVLRIGDVSLLLVPRMLLGRDVAAELDEVVPGLADARPPVYEPTLPYLRAVWYVDELDDAAGAGEPLVDDELLAAIEAEVSPADPCVVVYTSGSAATPKAVVHTHGTVTRKTATHSDVGLPGSYPGQRVLCAMPFFWVGGIQMLAGALHSGSSIVCQERFDVDDALDLIERERITSMLGWANVMTAITARAASEGRDISSLGSVPLATRAVGRRLTRSSRGDPPNLGMTETLGPHYRPGHFDYRVVDPDTGDDVPEGVEGEFWVRGYGLMAAMYKLEREEVFDEDGWYHTGDLGYLEGDRIFYTGRSSEMVKARGANVSPLEVETVLQSFPEVRHAFVFGVPDDAQGERVAAVVVPEDGALIDPDALRQRARAELSAYKVPTLVRAMTEDDVPWLASGKPDKITMRKRITKNEEA